MGRFTSLNESPITVQLISIQPPSSRVLSLVAARGMACWLVLLLSMVGCSHMQRGSEARPIVWDSSVRHLVPRGHGGPHLPRPLASAEVPAHPFMAPHGASSMHTDPFTTNTYSWAGPLGRAPEVSSRAMGFLGGECPTINFDKLGRIITVCVNRRTPSLLLLDPTTLRVLASHELPSRNTAVVRIRETMNDTSGGAYFYLDQHDRAVVGTADGEIQVIGLRGWGNDTHFHVEARYPLQRELTLATGELDRITAVMPDFKGNYWFVARYGTVGVVQRSGQVRATRLRGEEIENSFSMAPEGPYIVSDHALYHLKVGSAGEPVTVWREPYDRGVRTKVGQINQGSGTTPTLLGNDYVAIADNAEPRLNVLVYRRTPTQGRRLVCQTPVFAAGQSATENTLIGHGRSLVVENNAGYDLFLTMRGGKTSAPGLTRIDVRSDESGCDVVWESREISQTTVPKLSTATGLVYLYTKLPDAPAGADAYYFTAVDFETGKTVYRVLTGTGVRYDNNWAAISLAPDGTAYVGVLNGLLKVRDGQAPLRATSDVSTNSF